MKDKTTEDDLELLDDADLQQNLDEKHAKKEQAKKTWQTERREYAEVKGTVKESLLRRTWRRARQLILFLILLLLLHDGLYILTGIGIDAYDANRAALKERIIDLENTLNRQEEQMADVDFEQHRDASDDPLSNRTHREYTRLSESHKENTELYDKLTTEYNTFEREDNTWLKRLKVRLRVYFGLVGLYDES